MPRPEVTAHPATAKCARHAWSCGVPTRNKVKAGHALRHDAEPGGHVCPPSDGKAQGRWSAASRRGTEDYDKTLIGCSCRARRSRPTQRLQSARQVVRGVPTRNKVGRSLVAHAAPGGHGPPSDGPPSDCKVQGRWSAASRRGTKSAGHSLLMPRPEVAAHPATAKCKAGGPRRPDAELILNLIRFDNTSFGRSVCFKMLPAIANE